MNGLFGSITKLKDKGADKIFYKNGSVSLSHFLGFQGFLTFSTRDSLQMSRFLSAFSKAGQITGTPGVRLDGGIRSSGCVCIRTKCFHTIILFYSLNTTMSWRLYSPFYSRGN